MNPSIGVLAQALLLLAWAARASPLGDEAAAMRPGEWKEFKTANLANDTVLFANVNGGLWYGDLSATWSNYLAWNPGTQEIYWLGAPHLQPFNFLRYSSAQNRWYNETDVPDCMRLPGYEGCFNHGYDDGTIDPARGVFYYHSGSRIFAYDIAKKSWSNWTQADLADSRASALEFFPPLSLLAYVIGPGVADGGLVQWIDPVSRKLETTVRKLEMGGYNNTMAYSPPYRKLFFGGGGDSKAFYSADSARKIARLSDAPAVFDCVRSSLAVDPVSGEPLVLANDNGFYAYSPASNAWRRLDGPPARLNAAEGAIAAMATGIPEYGVVFYLAPALRKVFLYKHASGGTAVRPGRAPRAEGIRLVADPAGGLTLRLPEGLSASGSVDLFDLRGRLLASFPAAPLLRWAPAGDRRTGPVTAVWRPEGRVPEARMAVLW